MGLEPEVGGEDAIQTFLIHHDGTYAVASDGVRVVQYFCRPFHIDCAFAHGDGVGYK